MIADKSIADVTTEDIDARFTSNSWALAGGNGQSMLFAAAALSPLVYGQMGAVPVSVVQISVFWLFMLVYGVMSIAILVQYAGGSRSAE